MNNLILTTLSKQELQLLIIDCVNSCLDNNQKATNNEEDGYITKKEAAKVLSCSTATIDNWRRSGKLKRYNLGKSVRFKRKDVLQLL